MESIKIYKEESIATRTVIGWRMCIYYGKLNKVTLKDQFPIPFINQMLKHMDKHLYLYYLDGYLRYFLIHPSDQEKTTFTFLYGTYTYKKIPFGIYNAPMSFQRCMMSIFSYFLEDVMEVFLDNFPSMDL